MALPYFFHPDLPLPGASVTLGEESSRHIISVLRMQSGDPLQLTDGHGKCAVATIIGDHRKRCEVRVSDIVSHPRRFPRVTLAVSPLKNASRFEWLLEKATEVGVFRIVPLLCQRTAKSQLRADRMKSILVSALLQSQQAWIPVLEPPVSLPVFLGEDAAGPVARLIAHCEPGEKPELAGMVNGLPPARTILIGPEGDFTTEEIMASLGSGYLPVGLGPTRLRTETAAFVAVVHLLS